MATKTWVGGTVGNVHNWFTLGNWGPGVSAPVAGDTVNVSTLGTPYIDISSGTVAAALLNVTNGNQLFVSGTGTMNMSSTVRAGGTSGTSTIFVWNSAVLNTTIAYAGGNAGGT